MFAGARVRNRTRAPAKLLRPAAAAGRADRQAFVDQFLLAGLRAPDHVEHAVVGLVAREFEQPRRDLRDEGLRRPWTRPRLRILDRVLVLDRRGVDEREPLGPLPVSGPPLEVGRRRLGVEVRRLDDQRAALPGTARDAQPRADVCRREWTPIQWNDP